MRNEGDRQRARMWWIYVSMCVLVLIVSGVVAVVHAELTKLPAETPIIQTPADAIAYSWKETVEKGPDHDVLVLECVIAEYRGREVTTMILRGETLSAPIHFPWRKKPLWMNAPTTWALGPNEAGGGRGASR